MSDAARRAASGLTRRPQCANEGSARRGRKTAIKARRIANKEGT